MVTGEELLRLMEMPVQRVKIQRPNKPKEQIMKESLPEKAFLRWQRGGGSTWYSFTDTFPFQTYSRPIMDVENACNVLDDGLVGREKEKKQLMSKYAGYCQIGKMRRPLLLSGEPGTGKSRAAQLFADMLGLKTFFINVPSITTPIALLGSEQHYSNSRVGILANALNENQTLSTVFVFDEIDKIVKNATDGSVEEALLQVFDPTWNSRIVDRSLDYPIDMSHCVIICTCNDEERLSDAFRDRLDVIKFEKYDEAQTREILVRSTVPKLIKEYGMEEQLVFGDDIVDEMLGAMPGATLRQLETAAVNLIDNSLLRMNSTDKQRPFIVGKEQLSDLAEFGDGTVKLGF